MRVAERAPVRFSWATTIRKAGPTIGCARRTSGRFSRPAIPALYVGVEDNAQHHQPTDDYDNMTHVFFVNAVETLRMLVEEFDRGL